MKSQLSSMYVLYHISVFFLRYADSELITSGADLSKISLNALYTAYTAKPSAVSEVAPINRKVTTYQYIFYCTRVVKPFLTRRPGKHCDYHLSYTRL